MAKSFCFRFRQIVILLLCLWMLAVLQSSANLFRLEEELHNKSYWGPQKYSAYTPARSFSHSGDLSKHTFEEGAFIELQSKNGTGSSTRLHMNTHRGYHPKFKHAAAKPKGRARSWWQSREPKELLLPKPIIVMGFPKAGTSSIFSFFQKQGLRSSHWYCCRPQVDPQKPGGEGSKLMAGCMLRNLAKNRSILQDCGDLDVYSEINGPRKRLLDQHSRQLGHLLEDGSVDSKSPGPRIFFPQHFHIQKIHDQYPNATFILNLRSIDAWAKSVMKWGDDLDQQFANEYYMQHEIERLPSNQTEMIHFLQKIYQEHNQLVRDFVMRFPSHTLIEINITSNSTGKILADGFGLDPKKWGHKNKNEKGLIRWRQGETSAFLGTTLWWILVVGTSSYCGWILGLRLV